MYVCTRRYTELHYQKKIIIKVGQYCIRQNETLSVYFHKAEHFTLKKGFPTKTAVVRALPAVLGRTAPGAEPTQRTKGAAGET